MPASDAHRSGIPRLLLVEDHVDTRQMYAEFLSIEFDVMTAADGEDALTLMRRQPPDLIITDLSLPRLNGFELIARIRSDAQLKSIPIICLSGYGGLDHERRALEAGCDRILEKPCMPDALAGIVNEMIQHAAKRRNDA
jgi:DNA-binding response OmpR family regulator